jgi:hypothetical protein
LSELEQNQDAVFWELRAGERLSEESVRQLRTNITGFFEVLAEWQVDENRKCNDILESIT